MLKRTIPELQVIRKCRQSSQVKNEKNASSIQIILLQAFKKFETFNIKSTRMSYIMQAPLYEYNVFGLSPYRHFVLSIILFRKRKSFLQVDNAFTCLLLTFVLPTLLIGRSHTRCQCYGLRFGVENALLNADNPYSMPPLRETFSGIKQVKYFSTIILCCNTYGTRV